MLEISKGALLRDHTQSIIKNGGEAEFKFSSISGNKKMSLQDYKTHKDSQIRIYHDEEDRGFG